MKAFNLWLMKCSCKDEVAGPPALRNRKLIWTRVIQGRLNEEEAKWIAKGTMMKGSASAGQLRLRRKASLSSLQIAPLMRPSRKVIHYLPLVRIAPQSGECVL